MDIYEKIKEFIYNYKINIILGVFLLLIILISNFGFYYVLSNKIEHKNNKEEKIVYTVDKTEDKKESKIDTYKVDVKGSVKNPGVYKLDKGSRVIDAIKMAGGLTKDADTRVNNLSKLLTDEMVIIIYTKDEVLKFSEIKAKEQKEEEVCVNYNEEINNDSCNIKEDNISNDSKGEVDIKVSLNKAPLDLLMTLPGIGEAKAKSIISYREEKGQFTKIEDIMNVSGIGESVFDKIKDYITI